MRGVIGLRRTGLGAAVVALSGWFLLLVAPPAAAHAVLDASSPRTGQLVPAGTAVLRVELRFDEPVVASLGAIEVLAPSGNRVDVGGVHQPDGAGNQVQVGLRPGLAGGTYLVVWRVVSADDAHPVHGSFSFSVGRSGPVASGSAVNAADRSLGLALGATRFAGYVGLLLLVGLVGYFILCLPTGWTNRTGRRLLHGALAAACTATGVGLGLQAGYDVGGGWTRSVDPRTVQTLIGTRLGHAHVLRLDLLVAIWLMVGRPVKPRRTRAALVVAAILAALVTAAVEGHAGASALSAALDVAHLSAAGLWLGGLVALAAVDLPARRRARALRAESTPRPRAPAGSLAVLERVAVQGDEWTSVRRFSAVALGSVAVLVSTGVIASLREVPGIAALTGTRYGQLLLAKIAIIALVLVAATFSRARLRSHACDERRIQGLARSVVAETLLLTLTLGVTSALVATTPARSVSRSVQERTVHAGPGAARVTANGSSCHTAIMPRRAQEDRSVAECGRSDCAPRRRDPSSEGRLGSCPLTTAPLDGSPAMFSTEPSRS
jgi:copper transport protein